MDIIDGGFTIAIGATLSDLIISLIAEQFVFPEVFEVFPALVLSLLSIVEAAHTFDVVGSGFIAAGWFQRWTFWLVSVISAGRHS